MCEISLLHFITFYIFVSFLIWYFEWKVWISIFMKQMPLYPCLRQRSYKSHKISVMLPILQFCHHVQITNNLCLSFFFTKEEGGLNSLPRKQYILNVLLWIPYCSCHNSVSKDSFIYLLTAPDFNVIISNTSLIKMMFATGFQ